VYASNEPGQVLPASGGNASSGSLTKCPGRAQAAASAGSPLAGA
jgi:hypothetical protein